MLINLDHVLHIVINDILGLTICVHINQDQAPMCLSIAFRAWSCDKPVIDWNHYSNLEDKPFECVGTIAESRAAIKFLSQNCDWKNKRVVKDLAGTPEIQTASELELRPDAGAEHCIPSAIMAKLDAF